MCFLVQTQKPRAITNILSTYYMSSTVPNALNIFNSHYNNNNTDLLSPLLLTNWGMV
jgi:hypothetical protein